MTSQLLARFVAVIGRLAFLGLAIASFLYCVFTYVPFTWHQVLLSHLIPQLDTFAAMHRWLWWPAGLVGLLSLLPQWRDAGSRLSVVIFAAAVVVFGGFLALRPVLPALDNDARSLWWGAAFLIWPLWMAAVSLRCSFPRLSWATRAAPGDQRFFTGTFRAAVFVSLTYFAIALTGEAGISVLQASLWTLLAHLSVFLVFFVVCVGLGGFASYSYYPARTEFILFQIVGAGLLCLFFETKIFRSMTFDGPVAFACAALLAIAVSVTLASLSADLNQGAPKPLASGLELMATPLVFALPARRTAVGSGMAVLALAAYGASAAFSGFDWNYVLQESAVAGVWVMAFALCSRIPRDGSRPQLRVLPLLALALLTTGAYKAVLAFSAPAERVEAYAGRNVSFRLAHDLLTNESVSNDFFVYLSARSNIPRSVAVEPVQMNIAAIHGTAEPKPNIFVIVIDSLRRDYVSAYNPAVNFTPAMGSFAQDNIVMQNAFTHYGGTGLAEPSIWVGGMMLHKQYVTPFTPMNTLTRLVDAEGYRSLISMDTILTSLVPKTPQITDVDEGVLNMNYDLCRSLSQLAARAEPGVPVFAYTQPQNIHISVITREGKSVPAGETYPGFYAPYASRLKRMDACFGTFITELKTKGLYDSSIVILTSDHGDSLGEDGRFGHAYTIYPEIVRIPMIVHLPKAIRGTARYDVRQPVFSTDISPSLYYLLGQTPTVNSELYGRPLFTHELSEQAAYRRNDYLIASSYAAVYGLLSGDGQQLYIADAVNERDSLYDIPSGKAIELSAAERTKDQGRIHILLDQIDGLYQFRPEQK